MYNILLLNVSLDSQCVGDKVKFLANSNDRVKFKKNNGKNVIYE